MSQGKKMANFRLPVGILKRLEQQAKKDYETMTGLLTRILNKELPELEPEGEDKK